MKKLAKKDADGTITQFGLAGPFWDSWITLPYNWGGAWVDLEARQFLGEHPNTLEALQALQDLRWTYHVMPQPGEAGGGSGGFLAGTAAMAGWGTWSLQRLIESDATMRLAPWFRFRLAPWFRVGSNPLKGPINPIGLAMLSSARNKKEAWEFIKFATLDPEGNFLYALAAGALPGVMGVHQDWIAALEDQAPELNPMAFVQQVAQYPAVINIRFLGVGSLLLAMLVVVTAGARAQNLVVNPGFEAGMENWDVAFGGAGTNTAIDTETRLKVTRLFWRYRAESLYVWAPCKMSRYPDRVSTAFKPR